MKPLAKWLCVPSEIIKNLPRNESIIGYIDSIKRKIKQAEEFGVRKMVIIVRGGPSIKDPMKLFHDEIMQ